MTMQKNHCKQCGICCQKGGALLHKNDLKLVEQEVIRFEHLVTLRVGELVHDPVYNKLIPLEEEVVKIRGTEERQYPWHCIFHKDKSCSLYPLRPSQCEALFCTDTSALEAIYHVDRLTRHNIFQVKQESRMWLELANAHEEECSLMSLIYLSKAYRKYIDAGQNIWDNIVYKTKEYAQNEIKYKNLAKEDLENEISRILHYDFAFRDLCVEKANIAQELLPFILGRPIYIFLNSLGLAVQENGKCLTVF